MSALRLFLPTIFLVVFILIYYYSTLNTPGSAYKFTGIPRCSPQPKCVTLAFFPDTPDVRALLQLFAQNNIPQLTLDVDIVALPSNTDMQLFRYNQVFVAPNITQSAVFFDKIFPSLPPWSYNILVNDTEESSGNLLDFNIGSQELLDFGPHIKFGLDQALTQLQLNTPVSFEISQLAFPDPNSLSQAAKEALVGSIGLTFFYLGLSVTLIMGLNAIVNEKERNIRGYLRSFGMMDGPYWLSWFTEMILFHTLSVLIMMSVGYMYPNLKFFHDTSFFSNFFIFFVYGIEQICLSFMLSSLVSKTRAANILGFLIYFFGLGVAIVFSFMGSLVWFLYDPEVIDAAGNWMGGLSFVPAFLFSILVVDVQSRTVGNPLGIGGGASSSSSDSAHPGFSWADMTAHPGSRSYVPTVSWTLGIMICYSIAFVLFAWYLDNVISDSFGARRHPLFPFMPSYWGFNKQAPYTQDFSRFFSATTPINDTDVLLETKHEPEAQLALRIVNVCKTYNTIGFGRPVSAVNNLNMKCQTGTVLALLGHNGAGKTSLINILTGLTSATFGDAYIYGYSVTHDMDQIRSFMGVCPQFDVFWPELTAREHLQVAISMKLLNERTNLQHEVDEKLHGVRLVKVAGHQVQTYSGGMRRRLSVALSMVGNPKVIILDEPTTGIDPANRRYIWKLIHSIKKDKLLILTTHSMEEADRLGEKIAIMNRGFLTAVGSPLHLKSKFSSGYRISFVADMEQVPNLKQFVFSTLPEAQLTAENAGSLIYVVPDGTDEDKLSRFFSALQKDKIVRDWGVSNTTLEDVFLKVTNAPVVVPVQMAYVPQGYVAH